MSIKKLLLLILLFAITAFCFAQEKFWKFENEQSVSKRNTPQLIIPKIYRTLSLSFDQYKDYLNTAPVESSYNLKEGLEISLPYPDNSFKKFRIAETKIMEDALATEFPQIKTFTGQGIDDPTATVRIDYTTLGFHAYVLSPSGALFIDPYQKANNNLYITYFSKDYVNPLKKKFACSFNDSLKHNGRPSSISSPLTGTCIGTQLKTYRVAISCTGEYAIKVCPPGNVTKANTMSAIVTTMNRVNSVYQTELDIKMVLVGANASIVYINPATDPYSGNDDANTLIDESQSNITAVIGSSSFDIGHTFSTGAGGLASVGVVCRTGTKASGVTGLENPVGDAYDIDYVTHEMGHQLGATHTFEGDMGNCGDGGSRSLTAAYEVGSGTSVMGYAGICGSDNIQANSDPYFHTKSFDQIVAYTTTGGGNACPVVTPTGNNPPVVIMPVSGMKIPKETPFTLTGSATDIDGDAITYSWEEWDLSNLANGSAWNSGANSTTAPLFKARIPKASGSRTFPDIAVILANYPPNPDTAMGGLKGETLPKVARDIKFRLVARDNKPAGGGVATGGDGCSSTAPFKVVVTNDGPFTLTAPNTAVNWLGGTIQTVTWDVANTNSVTGINAQNVDIFISTDGGNTYPTTIASGIPNNGSASIKVPNIATNSQVRFMIKASGNIFFDISNVNFTITFNTALPVSSFLAKIQPNPFHNNANLFLDGIEKKNFEILITDVTGRVLSRKEITNSEETRLIPLGLNNQATGIYFIKFLQNDVEATLKGLKY
ncbi:MAG: zinc-dependent metalloprotease family protein [Ginsengibacter sp.]